MPSFSTPNNLFRNPRFSRATFDCRQLRIVSTMSANAFDWPDFREQTVDFARF
jgi:hypothetical protein